MTRRLYNLFSIISSICIIAAAGCTDSSVQTPVETGSVSTTDKPNIVFILIDDVGWNDVSYHGSEISTPNIDALAASGAKLERSYVFPICSPTRAALLTGQNPLKYGIDSPLALDHSLPLNLKLLPEYLKAADYDTWLVGKWHLGRTIEASRPNARGFDYYYGHLGGWVDHYTHVFNGGLDWQRNDKSIREDGHATKLLTKDAIKQLNQHEGSNPFFLYMAYNAPHTPLQKIEDVKKTYPSIQDTDRRIYAEMMTDLDDHIGQLIKTLKGKDILDETLIVLMSDNGGAKFLGSDNTPLRGGKGLAFEGGLRTPAIVSWNSRIEPNQTIEDPVFIQNWAPTLLDAAQIDYTDAEFDGLSHWSLITGEDDAQTAQPIVMGSPKSRAVFSWPYKYVRHSPRFETSVTTSLFNIKDDPRETTDITERHPEMAAQLAKQLEQYDGIKSLADNGPRPESQFQHADGKNNYDLRLPETRKPWVD